jgi:hypothetical protein
MDVYVIYTLFEDLLLTFTCLIFVIVTDFVVCDARSEAEDRIDAVTITTETHCVLCHARAEEEETVDFESYN